MEDKGWLTSERVVQDDKPNKKVYSLADAGREELKNWLSTPEADINDAMSVRSAFLMRVFFAGEISDEQAISMLRAFREKCLESLSSFNSVHEIIMDKGAAADNVDRKKYWEITAQYGKNHYQASLQWVENAISMLEGEK